MAYLWRRLEEEYGKPIDEILLEHLNKYGIEETVSRLGIHRITIYKWLRQLGVALGPEAQ